MIRLAIALLSVSIAGCAQECLKLNVENTSKLQAVLPTDSGMHALWDPEAFRNVCSFESWELSVLKNDGIRRMSLVIDYKITGQGWAECTLSDAAGTCTISASYLSDALGNLMVAAVAVASGFKAVTFRFDEEPGEFRWVIRSPRLNELELTILEFPQLWGDKADWEGEQVFRSECLPSTFATAVLTAAEKLRNEIGVDEYKEKWGEHAFPSELLQVLARLVRGESAA